MSDQTYIITYDIKQTSSDYDYEELFQYFKSHGTWAHIAESVWAIKTEKNATTIRDEVRAIVPTNSTIFVIKSGLPAAWSNIICKNQWLKDNL